MKPRKWLGRWWYPPMMHVDGLYVESGFPLPWTHKFAYRWFDRDIEIWAWPGLHLVLRAGRWYMMHRWALERWGVWRRYHDKEWIVFDVIPGDYYSNGHWVIRHV